MSDSHVLLEKDKCVRESCGQSENFEDEAKAAASAVASITSDKIVVNGLCSVSISDATNFETTGVHGIEEGHFLFVVFKYVLCVSCLFSSVSRY